MTLAVSALDDPKAGPWRALVEKTLKDRPAESLAGSTLEGLAIAPLYTPAGRGGGLPSQRPGRAVRPWDLRTAVSHPDPARANADLLADLEGGAASVLVRLDPTGAQGVAVGSQNDLDRTLAGVMLDVAPVAVEAGFLGPRAADWLSAAAKGAPSAQLLLHLDPLSALAEAGVSSGPIESHLVSAATVSARLAEVHPQAGLFLASGVVIHEAGGGEALELAFAAGAALTYARALVRAGLSMERAWGGIVLGLAADQDYFVTLAKLRAARQIWARLTAACGVQAAPRIEARSSRRMLTVQDPWTNMLRLGAAAVGAALGGADAVVLGTYTDALGHPTAFARRQSRNTQLVLMEEAHLGRVSDPAAGSGYVEALTDEIARAAWAGLRAMESLGGIVEALSTGHVANEVARACEARAAQGQPRIVGVTAFPPVEDRPVETEHPVPVPADAPSVRLPGPDSRCPPLAPLRLSQPWEPAR